MQTRILTPLMLLLSLSLLACGGRAVLPPEDVVEDPVVLFEAMLNRLEPLQTLRATVNSEVFAEGSRVQAEQVILARVPGDLRVETLSPFDTTLAVFMVRNGRLVFYDLQQNRWVEGTATPENISRFVPFWMSAEDLVRVLFGGPPLEAVNTDPDSYALSWDTRAGRYLLELPLTTGGHLALGVRHGSWVVERVFRYDADGELLFELRTGAFEALEGVTPLTELPRRMRFLMESQRLDITLDVRRVSVNVMLPDPLFELEQPSGSTAEVL